MLLILCASIFYLLYILSGLDSLLLFIYFLSCYIPFRAKSEEGSGAYTSCAYVKAGDTSSPLGFMWVFGNLAQGYHGSAVNFSFLPPLHMGTRRLSMYVRTQNPPFLCPVPNSLSSIIIYIFCCICFIVHHFSNLSVYLKLCFINKMDWIMEDEYVLLL